MKKAILVIDVISMPAGCQECNDSEAYCLETAYDDYCEEWEGKAE